MPDLRIEIARWSPYPDHDVEHGKTSAYVGIYLGNNCITKNECLASAKKGMVRDEIYVSLYPLAMWFASSWWRLNNESLPTIADSLDAPSESWRFNHEMASIGMGYAWPTMSFYADGENIQIRALPTQDTRGMPIKYLNGTDGVKLIPKREFADSVSLLIENVIDQLNNSGCENSDLEELWGVIKDDQNNPRELQKRRLEAELGFDPEECPARLMKQAIEK